MGLLKRLPVYAAGLGFTLALVAVADAWDWSGGQTLLAALAVGTFYVVTILVPWLIREQVADAEARTVERIDVQGSVNAGWSVTIVPDAGHSFVPYNGNGWPQYETLGPAGAEHSAPVLSTR